MIERTARTREGILTITLSVVSLFVGCGPQTEEIGDATEHFLAAQEALDAGNTELAIDELSKSLALKPDVWGYYQRAQLLVELDRTDEAIADCEAGLALDSSHAQLKWLHGELKKPKDKRFRGRYKNPPVENNYEL